MLSSVFSVSSLVRPSEIATIETQETVAPLAAPLLRGYLLEAKYEFLCVLRRAGCAALLFSAVAVSVCC